MTWRNALTSYLCWKIRWDKSKQVSSRLLLFLPDWLPITDIYLFFLTHTRTLTRALVLSQLQPSGTMALIGVQQSGAAMTAASIVNMTACYLFNTENRRVFGGVCVQFTHLCTTNTRKCTPVLVPLQVRPSSSSTRPRPHSQRQEPLVFTHTSAQPPLPWSHSFTSEHTHTGSDINIRWVSF